MILAHNVLFDQAKPEGRRRKQLDPLPAVAATPRGIVLPPYYDSQLLLTGKCLVRPAADRPPAHVNAPATAANAPETFSVGRRLVSLSTPHMKQSEAESSCARSDVTTGTRHQGDAEIEGVARRHVYAHQIPSMLNRGSRAAEYVADIRRTMFPERRPEPTVDLPAADDDDVVVGHRVSVTLVPIVHTPRIPHSRPVGVTHPPNKDLMRARTIALMPKS